MQRRTWVAIAATAAAALATPLAWSQSKEIRIAHIYSRTGPL
jgi:branched-chain amino acid transport system substrate-binding protein